MTDVVLVRRSGFLELQRKNRAILDDQQIDLFPIFIPVVVERRAQAVGSQLLSSSPMIQVSGMAPDIAPASSGLRT
jgi:hypothetical protein